MGRSKATADSEGCGWYPWRTLGILRKVHGSTGDQSGQSLKLRRQTGHGRSAFDHRCGCRRDLAPARFRLEPSHLEPELVIAVLLLVGKISNGALSKILPRTSMRKQTQLSMTDTSNGGEELTAKKSSGAASDELQHRSVTPRHLPRHHPRRRPKGYARHFVIRRKHQPPTGNHQKRG